MATLFSVTDAQAGKRQPHRKLTMKWNIKLDMENRINGLIDRNTLQAQMCFIFSRLTKILKCQHTLYSFVSLAMPTRKPKLAKKCNYPIVISNFEKKFFYA